jgi:ferric-dicitrate binding protein FerR (iron transport regulator)
MEKFFKTGEDLLTDESFLSWYYHPTPEKEQEWNNWLALYPDQKQLVDDAVATLSRLNIKEDQIPASSVETAWQRLDSSINGSRKEQAPVLRMKTSRKWWRVAAAAAIILFAGLSIWKFSDNKKTTLAANYGEIANHQLPDGSEVILNANSSVTLGKNWEDGNDREVWLKGEAFFHVTKTSQHNRFIVHANRMDIIVTGTQFNVITRDDRSSVFLTEGSVVIRSKDGKETLMKPGDFVAINNNQFEKKPVNEESILAWKENKLFFDNIPMPEAAKIISEHYGIKVTLGDQQVKERALAGFMQNNNLDVLIRSFEEMDFKITKKDNEIIISSQ